MLCDNVLFAHIGAYICHLENSLKIIIPRGRHIFQGEQFQIITYLTTNDTHWFDPPHPTLIYKMYSLKNTFISNMFTSNFNDNVQLNKICN
jgi:hypothetical protein